MRKLAPLLALSVSLLALTGWTAASDQQPTFSRSRWLEEQQAWGARVPETLGRENPRRLRAFLDKIAATRPAPGGIPKGVVRLSADLLASIAGPAQPETEVEPFFGVDPENPKHILAGYQEDRFPEAGCRNLTSTVSFNSGRTWRESLLPNLTVASGGPYERTSDPWVAFGPGGRAYFASLGFNETNPQNGVYLSASDDGGLTWGEPVSVHSGTQTFDDKEAVVVDTRDDSPYKGRVYVGWDWISADGQQPELMTYSDDGGQSFRAPITVADQGANVGILPLVGPAGIVHAIWLNFLGNGVSMLAAHSTDGGQSWSAPVRISDVDAAGVAGSRTGAGIPAAAIDTRTGSLYVVWQDERFTPGTDQVVLSRSTDGGLTWSAPQLASDGPGGVANFTPAVAVSPEGWVGVSYYSLRNDPSGLLVDEYLAVSRNGGQQFAKSLRVSPASWDLRFAATSEGFFLGDYQGLATSAKTFYPLWIATFSPSRVEPSVRQPDVFTRTMKVR
ncbi:MAG TPA: sialidase family protein [Thermoanaerobaculia bacterium]